MNTYNQMRKHIDLYLERAQSENKDMDMSHIPSVKVSLVGTKAYWLITEADPTHNDIYRGLCELSFGFPEIGSFSLREIYDLAEWKDWAISITPIYDQHDLQYYLERSKHTGVTATDTVH